MTSTDESPVIAVYGASGFIGSAVMHTLRNAGVRALPATAPRLAPRPPEAAHRLTAADKIVIDELQSRLQGVHSVINCAGLPGASSQDHEQLTAANATLPAVLAKAAGKAHCNRFVHVSSAVVQGRAPMLDQSQAYEPFSPYASSKIAGEVGALSESITVVYRPPSVHAPDRPITRAIARIANSPLNTVATPGNDPTPQAQLNNVASAIAFLILAKNPPPRIVIHPWEGMTTSELLFALGSGQPRRIPRCVARTIVAALRVGGSVLPGLAPNARRLELLWLGQRQAASWLEQEGWKPPIGREGWFEMAREVGAP